MNKSTKMWAVIDIYYKHAEGSLHSFVTEQELRDFLINKLKYYSKYLKIQDCDNIGTESLIYYIIHLGKQMLEEQLGYGVKQVNMLDFETQSITVYE